MTGSDLKSMLFGGWRKWVTAGVALVVLVAVLGTIMWKDLHLGMVLSDLEDEPDETAKYIRNRLNLPYKAELREAYLAGGRRFTAQVFLGKIVAQDPFFMPDVVRDAMYADDLEDQRAAAVTFLEISFDPQSPAGPIDDRVLEVFAGWAEDPAHPWLFLLLQRLGYYKDGRLAGPLVTILVSEAPQDSLEAIGRSNRNREFAAQALKKYADQKVVMDAFETVIKRDKESDMVQAYSLQGYGRGGGGDDPEPWRKAAISKSTVQRQIAAANLRFVEGAWVVPLLLRLADDVNDVVRREAIDSLGYLKAPELLEKVKDYAEDFWDSIRGDLAGHILDQKAKVLLPFMAWLLRGDDPLVVEKVYVALVKLTKEHHGLTEDQWEIFKSQFRRRAEMMKEFMVDETRKEAAIVEWSGGPDKLYTDQDRVPHLIRQLGHKDDRNVIRAMKELVRVTGRKDGFPPTLIKAPVPKDPDPNKEPNERFRFMQSDRKKLVADWMEWWKEQPR